MKTIKINSFIVAIIATLVVGCAKNEDITFTKSQVEWDAASFNARTSGYPFTLLTRVPLEFGRGVYNVANSYGGIDPVLNRMYPDTVRMRVNLVSALKPNAETFNVFVDNTFTTATSGALGAPGAHFQLVDNTVTVPAGSSFGIVRWVVRNPGATNNIPVTVVFRLAGNSSVPVSQNFQYVGWSIAQ